MQSKQKVPDALQLLIQRNNDLLRQTQHELTQQVLDANKEMMEILGLNPDEGWRIDTNTMEYVKQPTTQDTSDATPIL